MGNEPKATVTLAGDLGQPISTLINRLSDATEGLARPWQMTRVAAAQAKADAIETESALKQLAALEAAYPGLAATWRRKHLNRTAIVQQALDSSDPTQFNPEEVAKDWYANFFDKSDLVSDEDMQALWARLLAGEARNPGSYSHKTVNLLHDMDKQAAQEFVTLCRFVVGNGPLIFLLPNPMPPVYTDLGVNMPFAEKMASLGLVSVSASGYQHSEDTAGYTGIEAAYLGTTIIFPSSGDKTTMPDGHVRFTPWGRELAQLVQAEPVPGFVDYLLTRWQGAYIQPPLNK